MQQDMAADLKDGPKIRLLFCHDCRSIEELPDFDGPAEYDTLLEVSVQRHEDALGNRHRGQLFDVNALLWQSETVRKQIIDQIKGQGAPGLTVVDPTFYDTRSTFYEDAMVCYKKHSRPTEGCPDYRKYSKKLVPKTSAERKDAGLAPANKTPNHIYLCDFCPVSVHVAKKMRGD